MAEDTKTSDSEVESEAVEPTPEVPAEPTPTKEDPFDEGKSTDFSFLDKDLDLDEDTDVETDVEPTEEVAAPAETPPVEAEPEPTPKPEAKAEAEPPAEEGKAEATPKPTPEPAKPEPAAKEETPTPAAEVPALPEEPQQPQLTPEEQQAQFAEWRGQQIGALTQHYQLSEEMVRDLEERPVEAVPRLFAEAHLSIATTVANAMAAQLPQMVNTLIGQRTTQEEGVERFFSAWPGLDKGNPSHVDALNRLGTVYRQTYPAATVDEYIAHVGAQATLALQIPTDGPANGAADPTPEPPTPAFIPAGSSAPAAIPKAKGSSGTWADFDQTHFEDLDDLDLG